MSLSIDERGYYSEHGETWPARVLANDIVQTFGPIDEVIAVTKWPGHECIVRLTEGRNSVTGGMWVSRESYAQKERQDILASLAALADRAQSVAA